MPKRDPELAVSAEAVKAECVRTGCSMIEAKRRLVEENKARIRQSIRRDVAEEYQRLHPDDRRKHLVLYEAVQWIMEQELGDD